MLSAAIDQAAQVMNFAQTGFFTTCDTRWIAIHAASSVAAMLTNPRGRPIVVATDSASQRSSNQTMGKTTGVANWTPRPTPGCVR